MPHLLRPAPKNQDSQKNIHCLIQFLDLQRGCQDFHNLKASENTDGREKLSTGGAETPPNTLTMEITGKSSFLQTHQNVQTGPVWCKDMVSFLVTCPLALGCGGSGGSSPFMQPPQWGWEAMGKVHRSKYCNSISRGSTTTRKGNPVCETGGSHCSPEEEGCLRRQQGSERQHSKSTWPYPFPITSLGIPPSGWSYFALKPCSMLHTKGFTFTLDVTKRWGKYENSCIWHISM